MGVQASLTGTSHVLRRRPHKKANILPALFCPERREVAGVTER